MSFSNFYHGKKRNTYQPEPYRINYYIKAPQVRLLIEDQSIGVVSIDQARRIAQEKELDLVEVTPNANPPVCKILDYSKFKYENKMRQKENLKKQKESFIHVKEIRLRPCIALHDLQTKINQAIGFLNENHKVKFNLQLKGHREMANKDQALNVFDTILNTLKDHSIIEQAPKFEGNRISCLFSFKNEIKK